MEADCFAEVNCSFVLELQNRVNETTELNCVERNNEINRIKPYQL